MVVFPGLRIPVFIIYSIAFVLKRDIRYLVDHNRLDYRPKKSMEGAKIIE